MLQTQSAEPLKDLAIKMRTGLSTFSEHLFRAKWQQQQFKGRIIKYLGGVGGLSCCCLHFFFLPPRENNLFLGRSTSDYFFFMFRRRIFCRLLSLLCTLPFDVFSGQHIFHQFRQQSFLFCPHFQQSFWWRQAIFYLPPPPPDIKWCVPKCMNG